MGCSAGVILVTVPDWRGAATTPRCLVTAPVDACVLGDPRLEPVHKLRRIKAISTVGSGLLRDEQATVSFAATLKSLAFNTKGGEGSQMFIMGHLCLVPEFSTCQDTPSFFICHPDQRLLVDGHQLVSNLQPAVLEQQMSETKI